MTRRGYYESCGQYEAKGHICRPPGWWRRWRDGVKWGAIWRCECGKRWRWIKFTLTEPGWSRIQDCYYEVNLWPHEWQWAPLKDQSQPLSSDAKPAWLEYLK